MAQGVGVLLYERPTLLEPLQSGGCRGREHGNVA